MRKKKEHSKKKPYSVDIKKKAIESVISKKKSVLDMAEIVGCGPTTIRRWVYDYKKYGDAIFAEDGTYYLYKHTTPNGKVYIGQTIQNPHTRWHNGTGYKHNKYFWQAINKYGWDNISHEIIAYNLSREEVNRLEKEYISKYKSNDRRFGYNITEGGDSGYRLTEETKAKLSKHFKGKPHPQTEEHNRHISQAKGHPVKQFTLDDEYLQTFWSTGEAARQLGKKSTHQAHIVSCCNGKRHQAFGFRWCWIEDEKPIIPLKTVPYQQRVVAKYHLDGRYIECYDSIKEAGASILGNESAADNIQVCCSGRTKMAYGYQWKYIDDEKQKGIDVEALKGHPRYKDVKDYLINHTKKETAKNYEMSVQTLYRYLAIAEKNNLDEDRCLFSF